MKRDHTQCLQEHQHRDIELRFERRVAQGNYALDTGYYLTRLGIPGNEWEYYGYFTVMMQRINGVWKIVLDTDSEEHATRELFMAAEPLMLE